MENRTAGKVAQADISVETDVEGMFEKLVETYGRLDLLVNNAGARNRLSSGNSGILMRVIVQHEGYAPSQILSLRFVERLPHLNAIASGRPLN